MSRKVIAHKGCDQSECDNDRGVRGIYIAAKIYVSADPTIAADGSIEFEESAPWESPLYTHAIECYDCGKTVREFNDELESYKLSYALKAYPEDYGVELVEVSN